MSDDLEFDFTDAELFQAFRLIASDDAEARKQTEAVRSAFSPGMDWAVSKETLFLLSLGSESGHEKVERIRKVAQEERLTAELREAGGPALSDSELLARVRDAIVAEDTRWEIERTEMGRALRDKGNQLP